MFPKNSKLPSAVRTINCGLRCWKIAIFNWEGGFIWGFLLGRPRGFFRRGFFGWFPFIFSWIISLSFLPVVLLGCVKRILPLKMAFLLVSEPPQILKKIVPLLYIWVGPSCKIWRPSTAAKYSADQFSLCTTKCAVLSKRGGFLVKKCNSHPEFSSFS